MTTADFCPDCWQPWSAHFGRAGSRRFTCPPDPDHAPRRHHIARTAYRLKTAASEFDVSLETIYKAIRNVQLPVQGPGRNQRVTHDDMLRWVAEGCPTSVQAA